jgi:hypothetical protein
MRQLHLILSVQKYFQNKFTKINNISDRINIFFQKEWIKDQSSFLNCITRVLILIIFVPKMNTIYLINN